MLFVSAEKDLKGAMWKSSYTREEILDAISLRPCHVTGEHDPNHTVKYICRIQLSETFKQLLDFLEIKTEDLQRKLHEDCYWCNGGAETRTEPAELRAWAADRRLK